MFDRFMNAIMYKSFGTRTAHYETPLNQNRKRHKIFTRFHRLYYPKRHKRYMIMEKRGN